MWAEAYDRIHQPGCGIDKMLATVDDEQDPGFADRGRNSLGKDRTAAELESENACHGGRRQAGIRQRGQFDEPAVTRKGQRQAARDL